MHRSITDLQLFIVDETDTQSSGQYIPAEILAEKV